MAEIAVYINEDDPHMVGAAWLLEQCGYERSQLSLAVERQASTGANRRLMIQIELEEAMDWEQKVEAKAAWLREYLAPLVGGKVTKVDATPSGPFFLPRLTVVLASGTEVQLKVDRDEEGNGAGFLFGLEHPGPAEDDSVVAQLAWGQRYLAPLANCEITKVDVEVDDDGAWPQISVRLTAGGEEVKLEVSQDEEGNGPGFLAGLDLPPRRG